MTLRTLPVSTNRLFQGRHILTREARETKEALAKEIWVAWRQKPIFGPVAVDIIVYWPDARRRDLDNALKNLLDAGTHLLWTDDSQIEELRIRKGVDRSNPRIEIEVATINPPT